MHKIYPTDLRCNLSTAASFKSSFARWCISLCVSIFWSSDKPSTLWMNTSNFIWGLYWKRHAKIRNSNNKLVNLTNSGTQGARIQRLSVQYNAFMPTTYTNFKYPMQDTENRIAKDSPWKHVWQFYVDRPRHPCNHPS